MLISKSHECCPKCVPKKEENCEYFGKTYYNGDIWYMNGCQHCACDYGRVLCSIVECESKFCLKDEIIVKKNEGCCVECRKPMYCQVDKTTRIKENEYWSPDSCKMCQCVHGEPKCFIGECADPSSFATQSQITTRFSKETELNLDNLSFLRNLEKLLNKETVIQIVAGLAGFKQFFKAIKVLINFHSVQGPKYGSIFASEKRRFNFTLSEIENLQISYKQLQTQGSLMDYIVFAVVSPYTGITYTSLLKLTLEPMQNDQAFYHDSTAYLNDDAGLQKKPYKTIYVIPGEAVKITSSDLKPKIFNFDPERLVYSLVSGKPKFGSLIRKLFFNSL
jgi:hypothetical protein